MRAGRSQEGMEEYERAVRGRPDFPQALYNLGIALADRGQTEEAVAHLSDARCGGSPISPTPMRALGKALLAEGRLAEGATEPGSLA